VLGLVLRRSLALVAAGLVIGLGGAIALSLIVPAELLATVSPRDPATFAATALLLSAVALIATYVPARRATKIDPLLALRAE
jgi:ABC-type antimicrobial peptide transport system permease subunit